MRTARLICLLFLSVLTLPLIGNAVQAADKRVALIVGIGRYQNAPALANPANDAKLIAVTLRRLDFDVQVVTDPDYEGLKTALRDFGRRLDGATVALFYYAGHGLQVAGRNYLLPVNAALARETDLRYEAFDVQAVLDEMDTPGRVNLVFLDACRDNPLGRSLASRAGRGGASRGLAPIDTGTGGTLIAYATAPGDVAQDGDGRNSPFTLSLSKHISTPGLDVRQMLTRVRGDVQKATSGKQRPWVNESLDSDFYFVPRSVPAPVEAPVSAPVPAGDAQPRPQPGNGVNLTSILSPEIVFWQSVANSKNPADYEAYLQQFPEGVFASLARLRLKDVSALPTRAQTPVTQTALAGGPPASRTPDHPVTGSEASTWTDGQRRAAQAALAGLGFYRGPINGDLDANPARQAVRTWQSFVAADATGQLTGEQRDRLTKQAEQQAELLKAPAASPHGVAAGSVRGAAARFARGAAFESKKDTAEAAYWYALAASDGSVEAFTNLGTIRARGPQADLEAARLLWMAAAARGGDKNGIVFYNLAVLAEKGIGGDANPGLAKKWYGQAASHKHAGSAAALRRLGG